MKLEVERNLDNKERKTNLDIKEKKYLDIRLIVSSDINEYSAAFVILRPTIFNRSRI